MIGHQRYEPFLFPSPVGLWCLLSFPWHYSAIMCGLNESSSVEVVICLIPWPSSCHERRRERMKGPVFSIQGFPPPSAWGLGFSRELAISMSWDLQPWQKYSTAEGGKYLRFQQANQRLTKTSGSSFCFMRNLIIGLIRSGGFCYLRCWSGWTDCTRLLGWT